MINRRGAAKFDSEADQRDGVRSPSLQTTIDMTTSSEQQQALTAMVFSNVGHSFSHMFTVLYATAVLYLPKVFNLPYGELLGLSSLGLVLFGVAALPAGWLGDRWSQIGMMVVYFVGIGVGAIVVGIAEGPQGLFIGLTLIGLFASIYHPVGIAWLVSWAKKQGMTLGINGLFGNLGSALAPVFVGLMIDFVTWRSGVYRSGHPVDRDRRRPAGHVASRSDPGCDVGSSATGSAGSGRVHACIHRPDHNDGVYRLRLFRADEHDAETDGDGAQQGACLELH